MGLNRNNLVLNLSVPGSRSVGTKERESDEWDQRWAGSGPDRKVEGGRPRTSPVLFFRSSALTESLDQTKFELAVFNCVIPEAYNTVKRFCVWDVIGRKGVFNLLHVVQSSSPVHSNPDRQQQEGIKARCIPLSDSCHMTPHTQATQAHLTSQLDPKPFKRVIAFWFSSFFY